MKLLSIESSAKAASVALTDNGRLVSQFFQASALTHSRTLLKMAEDMLSDLEMTVSDVDAVAVSIGPGSFTGIRIGVATAKGLCWGGDKPCIGVSTLEAMAHQLRDRKDVIIAAAMDARRSEIYNSCFLPMGDRVERLCEDRAIPISQLADEAKNSGKTYFFVGDGAELCYNAFSELGLPALLAPEPLRLQTAWGVAMAADGRQPEDASDLAPKYLRLSQAERERLQRLAE
ncbi:MAG: tRNA (adenosine(37)-N6)-threonylcarbamoyltransferase complex dimerization subunit type 1 TsaB [Oscillospiraceae bacterium]|nr:tRNA (adenosine(37)-N6)-threonylcarbamoyltransferase complex dimerization subunit type 1 TsaB [Oscillospiraceae bacterium]